ncbi:pendrin isoform X3 [Octopus sinensis]|nr:pendrin isoform X3 [Octopus sinensis]
MTDSSDRCFINIKRPVYKTDEFIKTFQKEITPPRWHARLGLYLRNKMKCSKRDLLGMFPIINVIQTYQLKAFILGDFISGITVGFMQLPQGMAYAMLSNLPPVIGLYMGFFPVILYAILGTSKHLSMGTIVVVSLLIGSLINDRFSLHEDSVISMGPRLFNVSTSEIFPENITISPEKISQVGIEKIKFAMAVTLISGITQLLMGILNMGIIVRLMSDSLVSGFSCGVAIYIISSQLKYILGLTVQRYTGVLSVPMTIVAVAKLLPKCNYPELLLSIVVMVIIYLVKVYINEKFKTRLLIPVPIDLIMVIFSTVVSYYLKLHEKNNFVVIGDIPSGLPMPVLPDISYAADYISQSIIIGLVAFAQSISVAVIIARKEGYDINANKELIAYGAVNIICPIFNCFTAAGALSRTTVQFSSGGKSQIASLFGSFFVLLMILAAGPLLRPLPNCVLSAIILVSLKSMLKEICTLKRLWRVSPCDCFIWIGTFLAIILTTIELGLIIGIGIGAATVLIRTQMVRPIKLGTIERTEIFRDRTKYQVTTPQTPVIILSYPSPLYYANVEVFQTKVKEKFAEFNKLSKNKSADNNISTNSTCKELEQYYVIIDCSAISFIDAMGAKAFKQLFLDAKQESVSCLFSCVNDSVLSVLKASDVFETLQNSLYVTTYDALMAIELQDEDV